MGFGPTQTSLTNGGVDELIKVDVVGEDDMAAHVKQKALRGHVCAGQATSLLSLQAGQVDFSIICFSKYTGRPGPQRVVLLPTGGGPVQLTVGTAIQLYVG